jgi:glycosyltransferase involved in cell wall biosynthesis
MARISETDLKVKILLVTGSFPPGRCGVGDYSFNLAKSLSEYPEIQVGILTSVSCSSGIPPNGVEVFPIINGWRLREGLKIVNLITRWQPDIVHIQYPTQGYGDGFLPWLLPIIAFVMRKKVVQTWHENYSRSNIPKVILKAVVPGGLVVVRPDYKDNLHRLLGWMLRNKTFALIRNASAIPRRDFKEKEKVEIKNKYLRNQSRLIVFFGFVYPHKGVDLLFEIADPGRDQIVIAGEIDANCKYSQLLLRHATTEPWKNKVTITRFIPMEEAAALLAVADAVVLPFRQGGGGWNTSIHGAVLQGTFVLTTSLRQKGYDTKNNVYYAKVDALDEMKTALNTYAGRRRIYSEEIDRDEWQQVAKQHLSLYDSISS